MPHIHIDYDYEKVYYDGSTQKVITTYRLFITDRNTSDYGYSIKQRNFNTQYSRISGWEIHSILIRQIIVVLKGAKDYKNAQKVGPKGRPIDDQYEIDATISPEDYTKKIVPLLKRYDCLYPTWHSAVNMSEPQCRSFKEMNDDDLKQMYGSGRRPSRKYKKSAKRVFRKKSRSTRRR